MSARGVKWKVEVTRYSTLNSGSHLGGVLRSRSRAAFADEPGHSRSNWGRKVRQGAAWKARASVSDDNTPSKKIDTSSAAHILQLDIGH